MNEQAATQILGTGGIITVSLYLSSLIVIGLIGRFARKENSLSDHFLAGRNLGLVVLFFTLYATQYSGNTLIGFAGKGYRSGFLMMMSVTAMMTVVAIIMLYAPRLHKLSVKHKFITPSDFIQQRFNSKPLVILVSLLCIWAMANYILSNLIAIGAILETSTGGKVPFAVGVVVMALIMVVYETLGGMRSVAWTDLIQGIILMIGIIVLFVMVIVLYDGHEVFTQGLKTVKPHFFDPPGGIMKRTWFSTIVLFGFGISVYPHLMQRFFAAKNEHVLKRSLQFMVFMPFATTMLVILVAVVGAWRFPELDKASSERILLIVINDMASKIPALSIMLVLFLSASLAAIMSTVDSALLTLASLFTQDFYKPLKKNATEKQLTGMGKIFSWAIMALMTWIALILPQTIWWLIQLKLTYFIQIAPAILLGVAWKKLGGKPVLIGMIVGLSVTLLHTILVRLGVGIESKPWGIHAGVWALAINFITITIVQRFSSKRTAIT